MHHRSLTFSLVACLFAFYAFALLPKHAFRLRQQGTSFLLHAGIAAALAVSVAFVTLLVLLKDDHSGYPSMRLSLATLLCALACVPTVWLAITVVGEVLHL